MRLFSMLFGSKSTETDEATRLGLAVSDVARELPSFSKDGQSITLTLGGAGGIRFDVEAATSSPGRWSSERRHRGLMPNDYLLMANGPLPSGLSTLLREVAEAYSEELFEFEGTATEVAVFWEEWGGMEKVRALHAHLDRLASW